MANALKDRPCPCCGRLAKWDNNSWRPFCSKRCKVIDLGLWAGGDYRIAGEKISPEAVVAEAENLPPERDY